MKKNVPTDYFSTPKLKNVIFQNMLTVLLHKSQLFQLQIQHLYPFLNALLKVWSRFHIQVCVKNFIQLRIYQLMDSINLSIRPFAGDCSLYIICVEGFGVVQNCVSGTCFDPVDLQCKPNNTNDQQPVPNVPQDNAELCLGTAKVSVFVPRIGTCDKFLYCIDNKFQGSYTCANHYHFSFNLQRCIHIGESSCNISKNN